MESKEEIRRQKKNENNKRYQMKHAEEISERRKERITCECGLDISKRHLRDHLKNSSHKKELQKRKELLKEKTNHNIANLILSFL